MTHPEQQAFEDLYRQTVDRVMAYCLRHSGDPQVAEDAVSETFLAAWRRRSGIRDLDLPWLIGTARNQLRNRHRTQQRQWALAERVQQYELLATPSPEVAVETRDALLRALAVLDEDDREALLLTCWDGLTSTDAARVLGVAPGTLRVRIHRARARMSETLDTPEDSHA